MINKVLVVGNSCVLKYGSLDNTGNLMHAVAARRLIKNYDEYNIGRLWTEKEINFIREKYSKIIFIAANAIRVIENQEYLDLQKIIASNLKRVNLQVVTMGLGAQQKLGESSKKIKLANQTIELINVISDLSILMGVRGEFTSEVLKIYGIQNSIPMGCPSIYYWTGQNFKYKDSLCVNSLNVESKVLINYTSFWREFPIFSLASAFPKSYIIGQKEYFEELCFLKGSLLSDIPASYKKIFIKYENIKKLFEYFILERFKKFYSLEEWLGFASGSVLSFGSRFHGNMVALNAGVPAVWFVHDMRTKELCDYHKLPHIQTGLNVLNLTIEQLLIKVDYSEFLKQYPINRERLRCYLYLSGVENML
jgi:hypothetical protein